MSEALRKFWRSIVEEWRDDVGAALALLLAYAIGEAGLSVWWVLVPTVILGGIVSRRVKLARMGGIAAGVTHVFDVADRAKFGRVTITAKTEPVEVPHQENTP